jgi:hypothetical protein
MEVSVGREFSFDPREEVRIGVREYRIGRRARAAFPITPAKAADVMKCVGRSSGSVNPVPVDWDS